MNASMSLLVRARAFMPGSLPVAGACIGLLALAAPALAEDGKTMPGSACHASFSSGVASLTRSNGLMLGVGSSGVRISCPVMKDIDAGRIKRAVVNVIDNNPFAGGDVVCNLLTLKPDGTVSQSQELRTSGSSGTMRQLAYGAQAKVAGGNYSLVCDLPALQSPGGPSMIISYNVVEE